MTYTLRDVVLDQLLNGKFQHKFHDTDIYFGPEFDHKVYANSWLGENLLKLHKVSLNPTVEIEANQAGQEIVAMLDHIGDKFPGATEYIEECLKLVPLSKFYTHKERMYAQLKGVDLYGWGEVDNLILDHKKINAIKLVRSHTGLGLKESKDIVDQRREFLVKQGRLLPITY